MGLLDKANVWFNHHYHKESETYYIATPCSDTFINRKAVVTIIMEAKEAHQVEDRYDVFHRSIVGEEHYVTNRVQGPGMAPMRMRKKSSYHYYANALREALALLELPVDAFESLRIWLDLNE